MLKMPSFAFCLFVHLFRVLLFLVAWFMVPLGFALGKIRQGELRLGQWGGAAYDNNGAIVSCVKVPAIIAEGLWKIFDIPDEPGIGLYEKTVSKIYNAKGWWWTVYYQLAFRNVGHGWLYLFAQRQGQAEPEALTTHNRLGPFYYGIKRYEDWRSYTDETFKGRRWYFVPDFGIGKAT